MRVLKYYTKDGWIPLYTNMLSKALFAENNLSELTDPEEARKNLELTGNNNHTHYHDDRYIPMINTAKDEILNQFQDLKDEIDNKKLLNVIDGDITNIANMEDGWYRWVGTLNAVSGVWIIVKMDSLYSATNINDPRIIFNSNDLTSWNSPYGYWHA